MTARRNPRTQAYSQFEGRKSTACILKVTSLRKMFPVFSYSNVLPVHRAHKTTVNLPTCGGNPSLLGSPKEADTLKSKRALSPSQKTLIPS